MKRLAAILLVGILFFNWYGYQLLTRYWEQRSDSRLQARLDRNEYDESQLLSIKIPITRLGYFNSSSEFQRVDGQIDIGGVRYQYVKRRIFGDSLELLCIGNEMVTKLQKVRNDFFRRVNDLQQHTRGKKTSSVKHISTDYQPATVQVAIGVIVIPAPLRGGYCFYIPSCYLSIDEMPPDQAPALS